MKSIKWAVALFFVSLLATAGATRILDGAQITNGSATLTLPTATDTLLGRLSTDTLTNKSIDGSTNTLTNVPMGAVSGTLAIANGGTGQTTQQAAIDALVPTQSAQSGKVLQTDGANVSWQTPASGGATIELDNLGTTALGGVALTGTGNVVPENNLSSSLGFNNKIWNVANIKQISIFDGSGVLVGEVAGQQQTIPTGGFVAGLHVRGEVVGTAHGDVFIYSEDDAFNDTDPTGDVLIASGNKTVGTADSGDVTVFIGAATGTQGTFNIQDPSLSGATVGDLWEITNVTTGAGQWATQAPDLSGTRASPTAIVAGTGIVFAGINYSNYHFIQGSGGAVNISANPQITAGTNVGQRLTLIGRDNTNTVTIEDGDGLSLNGSAVLAADSAIDLVWDSVNWVELARR